VGYDGGEYDGGGYDEGGYDGGGYDGGGYDCALAPPANVTSHSNRPSATKLQRRREIGSPCGPIDRPLKAALSGSTARKGRTTGIRPSRFNSCDWTASGTKRIGRSTGSSCCVCIVLFSSIRLHRSFPQTFGGGLYASQCQPLSLHISRSGSPVVPDSIKAAGRYRRLTRRTGRLVPEFGCRPRTRFDSYGAGRTARARRTSVTPAPPRNPFRLLLNKEFFRRQVLHRHRCRAPGRRSTGS
jgi:hypothetical protein